MKIRLHQSRTVRRLVNTIAAAGFGAGVLAGCGSSGPTASNETSASTGPAIPVTSSSMTGTSTWASLAMGHLNDPLNTFWELLHLSGSRWRLATPPGVASNGGLVMAVSPGSVLAAFGPSQDLLFSPLAYSADQGSSWQTGVLPSGVSLVPEALAQRGHESLALLHAGGGEVVVASSADLSTWTPAVTAAALRRQSGTAHCQVRFLTAVGMSAGNSIMVGASCAHGGRAGLFVRSSTSTVWSSAGPEIPGASAGPTQVVRLDQTTDGVAALVSAGSGAGARLYGMWSASGDGPWTVSTGLPLSGASVQSTGVTDSGGFVVSTRLGSAHPSASVIGPHGSQWKSLPPTPAHTASVTAGPEGTYDALVPVQSTLSIYGLGSAGWTRVQTLHVDVPYGSSS